LIFDYDPEMWVVSYVGEKHKSAMKKMNDPNAKFHSDVVIPQHKEVDVSKWIKTEKKSNNRLPYFECTLCKKSVRRDHRIDHICK